MKKKKRALSLLLKYSTGEELLPFLVNLGFVAPPLYLQDWLGLQEA